MRNRALIMTLAACSVVGIPACGTKDEPTATPPSSTAGSPSGSTAGSDPGAGSGTVPGTTTGSIAPGTTQPAACADDLRIVNAAAEPDAGLDDRPLALETSWADEGPHPDNTVDMDSKIELAFAEFVIEKDPQFGYAIPIGGPTAPPGAVYLAYTLTVPSGKIEAGQRFVGSTASGEAEGSILTDFLYSGSARLLPGEAEVTITSLTDDEVCGTITSTTRTSLQTFIGVEGSFRADRIQALEAAEGD